MESTVMDRKELSLNQADRIQRIAGIFLAALVVFWLLAIAGQFLHAHRIGESFSLNMLFLKNAKDAFDDFTMFNPVTNRFGTETEVIVYPAPMMCGYILYSRLFPNPVAAYESSIVIFGLSAAGVFAYFLNKGRQHRALLTAVVFCSLLLSFPLMFDMERANTEAMVWFVQVFAMWAFVSRRYMVAGLLIALATSMKIYPGLLFLLFLPIRQYRVLAISVLACIPINLAGLWIVGPSVVEAAKDVLKGMGLLGVSHIFHVISPDLGFDHSLLSLFKQTVRFLLLGDDKIQGAVMAASLPYAALMFVSFCVLYGLVIRKLPVLNQVVILAILSTLLPPLAIEYTLIQLYVPWAVFLFYLVREKTSLPFRQAALILICFAFLFSPAKYLSGHYVSFGGQFKILAMLTIVFILCRRPLPSIMFGELPRVDGKAVQ